MINNVTVTIEGTIKFVNDGKDSELEEIPLGINLNFIDDRISVQDILPFTNYKTNLDKKIAMGQAFAPKKTFENNLIKITFFNQQAKEENIEIWGIATWEELEKFYNRVHYTLPDVTSFINAAMQHKELGTCAPWFPNYNMSENTAIITGGYTLSGKNKAGLQVDITRDINLHLKLNHGDLEQESQTNFFNMTCDLRDDYINANELSHVQSKKNHIRVTINCQLSKEIHVWSDNYYIIGDKDSILDLRVYLCDYFPFLNPPETYQQQLPKEANARTPLLFDNRQGNGENVSKFSSKPQELMEQSSDCDKRLKNICRFF